MAGFAHVNKLWAAGVQAPIVPVLVGVLVALLVGVLWRVRVRVQLHPCVRPLDPLRTAAATMVSPASWLALSGQGLRWHRTKQLRLTILRKGSVW